MRNDMSHKFCGDFIHEQLGFCAAKIMTYNM